MVAELLALGFYYPFDLIKTRMQTATISSPYQYKGTLDAFLKIIESATSLDKTLTIRARSLRYFSIIRALYSGSLLYAINYTALLAFEFSIFEGTLHYLESD